MTEKDYLNKNKSLWNNRTGYHVDSSFYAVEGFIKGKSSLTSIELELLGDINGKSVLHLQCHFGQDSLSMARLGASVTGIDLSDVAVAKAKELNKQLGLNAEFICCDVYDTGKYIKQQFDIVFTSFGTIGWLPDINKWAAIVANSLKPGGKFVFAEFHPVVWMFDNDFTKVEYRYFKDEAIVEEESGTYAEVNAPIKQESVSWNHSLGEVIGGLIKAGLTIETFNEYDYSPFNCFRHTEEFERGKFRIKQFGNKIPMVYSLTAIK